MLRPLICIAFMLAGAAHAGTLAADSLLCESPGELEFAKQDNLRGKPGSKVIETAALVAKGWQLREQGASLVRASPKTTVAEEVANARAQGEPYQRIVSTCAATAAAQSADILERRAISGLVRVRTAYQGRPAELWTYAMSVAE